MPVYNTLEKEVQEIEKHKERKPVDTATLTSRPVAVEASDTPSLLIHPSARPLLTADVHATLECLLRLLESEAHTQGVPVSKIEVHGFADPEEDTDTVVVTQWVGVPPQTALAYWDHLGAAVEAWTEQLPSERVPIAAERIAIEVRWDADAPAT